MVMNEFTKVSSQLRKYEEISQFSVYIVKTYSLCPVLTTME